MDDNNIDIEEIKKDQFESGININIEERPIDNSEEPTEMIEDSSNQVDDLSHDTHQTFNEKMEKDTTIQSDKTKNQIVEENKNELPKFYDDLRTVMKTQENILTSTLMAKEKIKYANEISLDQLKNFKDNSQKYGKYLKLIHDELNQISDLMKKIKKEIK